MRATSILLIWIIAPLLMASDGAAQDLASLSSPRLEPERDAEDNALRDPDGAPILIPVDRAPAPTPTGPVAAPAAASVGGAESTLAAAESATPLSLEPIWSYGIWGTSLGRTGLDAVDLDGDGHLEIVMGTSISGGFSSNSAWLVLKFSSDSGAYSSVWNSGPVEGGVGRVVALTTGGRPHIFVGRGDGRLMVHDGTTFAAEAEVEVATTSITDILLGDADNDGQPELIVVTSSSVHLLNPTTYLEESRFDYGGSGAALGNVDADPALELVLQSGAVLEIQGSEATLEWDFSSFATASYIGLTDLDGDGMEEIVAARSWYYIDVYDADLRSPKFQIHTGHDIQALLLVDVTGDGRDEILYGDGQWGSIHAHDASDGTLLWSVPNPSHGTTRIEVADTDADGALELIWGAGWTSTGADFLYVHDLERGELDFQSLDLVGPFSAVALGDADDDGTNEIVAVSWESNSGYADGVIHVFDSETFELEWQSGTNFFGRNAWTGVHDVAIGDVDDDGATEIVIGTDRLYDGTIYVIDGKTHAVEAHYLYDSGSPIYSLTLADVDGDGRTEIVAGNGRAHTGSPGTSIYVIDGATGVVEWKSASLVSGWTGVYALEVVDLNGDGSLDIVGSAGAIVVVDGATHAIRKTATSTFLGFDVSAAIAAVGREIWAGTTGGELVRIEPDTLEETPVAIPCSNAVNAVRLDRVSSLDGAVEIACDDEVLIWGRFEEAALWRSADLGSRAGYRNNLMLEDRGEQALLIAGTQSGVVAYQGYGTSNTDIDDDGVSNYLDNCVEVSNSDQTDTDGDGIGDACNDAFDADGDEFADARDNCPEISNSDQSDTDGNGTGNACNDAEDLDGDEWADSLDLCVDVPNPDQANRDGDDLGDACDPYPDNPDNYAARCEEAVSNELVCNQMLMVCSNALTSCEAADRFVDSDGDGEEDRGDRCPNTPAGAPVDAAGCSRAQFCDAVAVKGARGIAACMGADWQNDEPGAGLAGDCRISFGWRSSTASTANGAGSGGGSHGWSFTIGCSAP